MPTPHRRPILLGLSVFAIVTAPILANGAMPGFEIAVYAGNGNGGGNGNGNSDGGGNGNGGGNGGGSSDQGGGNGNPHQESSASAGSPGGGSSKKSRQEVASTDDGDASFERGKGNINSQLGGLNSLKRNINGLMNSADPRMDDIRKFIVASADLVDARAVLEDAIDGLAAAEGKYLELLRQAGVVDPSLDITPDLIDARIQEIEDILEGETPPDDPTVLEAERDALMEAFNDLSAQWDLLAQERSDLASAEAEVVALEDATDEGALEDALRSAANRNRDVTDEVVAWASAELGVGDADGLIDDYMARRR